MFETYTNFTKIIGKGILVAGMTVANWFGIVPESYFIPPEPETKIVYEHEYINTPAPAPIILGATSQQGDVKALFETTLASKITSSATSMTLTSATDKDGNALASSTYGFILDEGTSVEEFVLADCTGTTCTNMTRGLSVSTGTTTVSTLQFEHRRGASVKITDAPSLIFATNFLRGKQNAQNVLKYDSSVGTSTIVLDNRNLVNYELLAYTAFNGAGVINASQTQKGLVEMATNLQVASSTSVDTTGAPLAVAASSATSTYNSATAGLKVVVTQNNGKIDSNFLPSTVVVTTAQNTFTATTTFATTTATGASNIASTSIVKFTGSGTWTKRSNLRYVIVEVQGAGGGGGGNTTSGGTSGAGGGGGYSRKVIPTIALGATETVTVGAGGTAGAGSSSGTGGTGGTTSFGSHLQATGGVGGNSSGGGTPGIGSGGDFNIQGGGGGGIAAANGTSGGSGGSSYFGGGGSPPNTDGSPRTGINGYNYGGGASGGHSGDGSDADGGVGADGVVVVTEVYF